MNKKAWEGVDVEVRMSSHIYDDTFIVSWPILWQDKERKPDSQTYYILDNPLSSSGPSPMWHLFLDSSNLYFSNLLPPLREFR